MGRVIRGSRILITGASSGIGRALAGLAAQAGARVAVASRSMEKLEQLAAELKLSTGADILPVAADVTSEADRRRLLDTVVEHFDGLDVLVNNAGVGSFGHFAEQRRDPAADHGSQLLCPGRVDPPGHPHPDAGPTAGHRQRGLDVRPAGVPAWSEYSASKFALCGLTEALRGEMARFDIDVLLHRAGPDADRPAANTCCATPDDEDRLRQGPCRRKRSPGRSSAAWNSNRTETVIGGDANWILRLNRWLPRLVDRLMRRGSGSCMPIDRDRPVEQRKAG